MFAFNRSLPVRVILLIVGLEPLDQLWVDCKGVLAVGEGVPHLKARFDDFEMTIDYLKNLKRNDKKGLPHHIILGPAPHLLVKLQQLGWTESLG